MKLNKTKTLKLVLVIFLTVIIGVVLANAINVGIGTSSPGYTLEIEGSSSTVQSIKGSNTQGTLLHIENTNVGPSWNLAVAGNNGWSPNGTFVIDEQGRGQRLVIAPGGNVGIGETAPQTPLHISRDTQGAYIKLKRPGHQAWRMGLVPDIAGGAVPPLDSFAIGESDDLRTQLYFTIAKTSGNVGIGTSSPKVRLAVNGGVGGGNLAVFRVLSNAGDSGLGIGHYSTDSNSPAVIRTFAGEDLYFTPGGIVSSVPKMVVTSGGNVGIGITSPSSSLQIGDPSDNSHKYLQIDVGWPSQEDCNEDSEMGRMILSHDGVEYPFLQLCLGTGGWKRVSLSSP